MENKYYTPQIEEFHVGFEYESCHNQEKQWYTEISDGSEISSIKDYYLPNNEVRVKYLDQQDIEELGFILKAEERKDYSHWCHFIHKSKEIELHVQLGSRFVPRLLTIGSLSRSNFISNFKIYIKNKSELKKLMKQLQIN